MKSYFRFIVLNFFSPGRFVTVGAHFITLAPYCPGVEKGGGLYGWTWGKLVKLFQTFFPPITMMNTQISNETFLLCVFRFIFNDFHRTRVCASFTLSSDRR